MGLPAVATWVRERRALLGYTRQTVAVEAAARGKRISVSTIQAVEDGKRDSLNPSTIDALAAGLRVDPDDIRALIDGRPPPPPADVDQVSAMFDWLTPDQRRQLLQGVRDWVARNPDYADAVGAGEPCDPVTAINQDPRLSDENKRTLTLMVEVMTSRADTGAPA